MAHCFAVQLLTSLNNFVVLVRNDYSSAEKEEFSLTEYVNPNESSNETLLRGKNHWSYEQRNYFRREAKANR